MALWDSFMKGMLAFSGFVWGDFMLYFLGLGALFITLRVGIVQFRHFGYAWSQTLGKVFRRKDADAPMAAQGTLSPFEALSTALANTIGSGNIVGVGLAVFWGGPGAVFWMWLMALLGMATKFTEAVMGQKYRVQDEAGNWVGGPQYYLSRGLKRFRLGWLGPFYGLMLVLTLGITEMIQCNSLAGSVHEAFGIPTLASGIAFTVLVAVIVFGGIKRIGTFAGKVVPFMAILYIAAGLVIVFTHLNQVPGLFALIFKSAFSPAAATGGFAGASVAAAMRWGCARGAFSIEAGDGAAAIAHATAAVDHPVRQGLYGIMEVFVDTILVCTTTALVVLLSGVWTDPASAKVPERLATLAFGVQWGAFGKGLVAVCLTLFAFTSMLAYVYYGEAQGNYFGGRKLGLLVRCGFIAAIFTGTFWDAEQLWPFCDVFFAFMIIPNMIGLFLLHGEYGELVREFFHTPGKYYLKDTGKARPV